MNNKIVNVFQGVFVIILGILIAVRGIGSAVNTYFGVVSLVAGLMLLIYAAVAISKKFANPILLLVLGAVLVTIAIALFIGKLDFSQLVNLIIFILMGTGFGLVAAGIFSIVKRMPMFGIGEIAIGALLILFTALVLGVPEFETAFWIIVGIMFIVFGVFMIIATFVDKKKILR